MDIACVGADGSIGFRDKRYTGRYCVVPGSSSTSSACVLGCID